MLKIEISIAPEDPRFAAIMSALMGAEAPKPVKTKPAEAKPAPAQDAPAAVKPAATAAKPVSLELIREKIVEYTGKDKEKYTPLIKGLLAEFGQKSASNLLKADYDSFYTQLAAL